MKTACHAKRAVLLGAILSTTLSSVAGAQSQTWLRQFGTTGGDVAYALSSDGAGGMFVSGQTGGMLGGPFQGSVDVWIARFDGAGIQQWIRQIGTNTFDAARASAPDGAGGVYVGGNTNATLGQVHAGVGDAWLARYDGSGNQTWIRQFGTASWDQLFAAAPDGVGGVYVSGWTEGSLGGPNAGGQDVWLAHYDGAGNQTWIRQFGTSDNDAAAAAASDGAGGVFVTGATNGGLSGTNAGQQDAWLARYDSAGNQTWITQLGTPSFDTAAAAALDGSGGVYVSGGTAGGLWGANAGGEDIWLARYDAAGTRAWIRQLGSSAGDTAFTAAPDGTGGVFTSGYSQGSLGGPNVGSNDNVVARYDGAGNQIWIRQFGTTLFDAVRASAADGLGGVVLGGDTRGALVGVSLGGTDAWLARHDGGLTTTRYCTPAVANSTNMPASLDATGSNVIAANDLELRASQMPLNAFGYFLTSQTQGYVPGAGGSPGNLCLGGAIGRFVGPGQVQNSGATGTFSLAVDLNTMPTPTGLVAVQAGETWHYQAWFRDANPTSTSNFTDAVSVLFF